MQPLDLSPETRGASAGCREWLIRILLDPTGLCAFSELCKPGKKRIVASSCNSQTVLPDPGASGEEEEGGGCEACFAVVCGIQ